MYNIVYKYIYKDDKRMIRPYVEEQLRKCVFANLDAFDPETNTVLIPKYSKPHYELNKCYLIQVPPHIKGNPNSIVATNWNRGTCPQTDYLKIFVSKTMGKMIFVDSLSYDIETKRDLNTTWSGWLPIEEIKLIASL